MILDTSSCPTVTCTLCSASGLYDEGVCAACREQYQPDESLVDAIYEAALALERRDWAAVVGAAERMFTLGVKCWPRSIDQRNRDARVATRLLEHLPLRVTYLHDTVLLTTPPHDAFASHALALGLVEQDGGWLIRSGRDMARANHLLRVHFDGAWLYQRQVGPDSFIWPQTVRIGGDAEVFSLL